jgi:hypothetical protein
LRQRTGIRGKGAVGNDEGSTRPKVGFTTKDFLGGMNTHRALIAFRLNDYPLAGLVGAY